MATRTLLRQAGLLLGAAYVAACLLSCTASPVRSRSVLRADHPRGPGSFCALNPEGCPPPPSPASAAPGAFDLNRCLKACDAGGVVLESFCRGLVEKWQRELCWGAVEGSKVACKNMCYAIHECMDDAEACPERAE